jgi:hypothetical protein
LVDSERSGGKFITIRIQRSTYQQLKNMAGADLPPEIYLENIIAQIAAGTSLEILTKTSAAVQTEITGKLAALAANLQRLTEITLENRRAIESLRTTSAPLAPGRFGTFSPEFKSPEKPEKPVEPYTQNNNIFPIIPTAEVYDGGEDDEAGSLEAKINQYEKDNPW